MIRVTVQLHSAISRTRDKELARFDIWNTGEGGDALRNYECASYRGRSAAALDRRQVNRSGKVTGHPAEAEHVLNLVAKALISMGYGTPGRASAAQTRPRRIDLAARPK